MCGDQVAADDLVQDACSRAIERHHQWKRGSRLDSWLFRIIQNLYRDQIRASEVRNRHLDESDRETENFEDGARTMENALTLGAVQSALQELSQEHRAVLLMVCVEGLSYRETAESLEIPIGTVMSRLARARQNLYEILNTSDTVVEFPTAGCAR